MQPQWVTTTATVLLPLPCMQFLRSPVPSPGTSANTSNALPNLGAMNEPVTAATLPLSIGHNAFIGNAVSTQHAE